MSVFLWGAMLYGLWEAQGGKMKFAGQKLRKCGNPDCDVFTSRNMCLVVNRREIVVYACLKCKPQVIEGKHIVWQ